MLIIMRYQFIFVLLANIYKKPGAWLACTASGFGHKCTCGKVLRYNEFGFSKFFQRNTVQRHELFGKLICIYFFFFVSG